MSNTREDYCTLSLFIDGREIVEGDGRVAEPVVDPASDRVLGNLPHATAADLDEAIAASLRAFAGWSRTPAIERSAILRRAAALLCERIERIAGILTLEQGKPVAESKGEIQHAIELFEWYAEEGRRAYGRIVPSRNEDVMHLVMQEPLGPCAAFTPWNFPMLTPARKVAGALAAGCTVILKPSEETPGTAVEMFRALHDAGLPEGCAQLVFGVPADVSAHLIAAPEIRKVSFTGSTPVGIHLMKLAADGVKRTTMELGGNAPVIVFDDADYDSTLAGLAATKLRNAGQVCISPGRFFVHDRVYDRFVKDLAKRFEAAVVGNGLDVGTTMGPLANIRRVEAMERFISDAETGGGKVLTGGNRIGNAGNFVAPAVVTDLSDKALLLREEAFCPAVPVVRFGSDEEVFARANSVEAGLAGYVFTRSQKRIRNASRDLKVGMVGINSFAVSTPETPFGGTKASGFGSEGGIEGLQAYFDTKLVTIA